MDTNNKLINTVTRTHEICNYMFKLFINASKSVYFTDTYNKFIVIYMVQ